MAFLPLYLNKKGADACVLPEDCRSPRWLSSQDEANPAPASIVIKKCD